MKIRQGFVSNSSSSSFMCDVCDYDVSGMDMGLSEAGMCECVNGHVFCKDHMDNVDEKVSIETLREFCLGNFSEDDKENREYILGLDYEELEDEAEQWDFGCDDEYDVSKDKCPICTFANVKVSETHKYLLKKSNLTEEQLLSNLKKEFKDYDEFLKFVKE